MPETLPGDGDPLDRAVLVADPTFPGCVVRARILGMFSMHDEKGVDAKLICVLEHDPQWDGAHGTSTTSRRVSATRSRISSASTRISSPEKSTQVEGFAGREGAHGELTACRAAYRHASA